MRKLLIIILTFSILGGHAYSQNVAFFEGTLEEAISKADNENKNVFIYFRTENSDECNALENDVFSKQEASMFLNSYFIPVRIDAQESNYGSAISKEYNIEVYPAFVILNAGGDILGQWSGSSMQPRADRFIKIVMNNMDGVNKYSTGIEIRTISFQEALTIAKAQEKYILLDCYTKWCGPCKRMDKDVFPLQEVGDYVNPRFIFVKSDMEVGEGAQLRERFGVEGYPTYIIFDTHGNEIYRFSGASTPEGFIAELRASTDRSMTIEALTSRYDAGERDKVFLKEYIAILSARYDRKLSEVVTTLFEQLTDQDKISPEYWHLYKIYGATNPVIQKYMIYNRSQFDATVGRKQVDELLGDILVNELSYMLFGNNELSKSDFEAVNEKIGLLGLAENPKIALYKATAKLKMDSSVDDFLDTFNEYADKAEKESLNTIVATVCNTMKDVFTEEQKKRFEKMLNDDIFKTYLKNISVN